MELNINSEGEKLDFYLTCLTGYKEKPIDYK